ncbi:GTPases - Sulfate adenylate transferase subunit 1 [Methanosarcina barkeri 3]|uniref:GTPases-Sulfate adenylate transferase subunit 1 n=1 Tax=Methanosarcina barkeri 3 TaxID=1434107 RepID=A0A0E3SLA2_METBA|nr:C39 family peptidase [Methanosarcina barkeri]AKB81922.1 GTPases - Sulfate adenylate transferase subunit 1 [Methanosarcina barkeri 3]
MKNLKTKMVFAIMLLMVALIPAVSAQKEDNYSVTAEEALEHANAHMISFIASDAPNFENWTGASIDPKPLELYDINGQKLFYQFSVYKNNNLIGRIDVCTDKTLGASVNNIEFGSKPFKVAEATKKSIEIAKNRYPTREIKSTNMVVYSYPRIGAMTVVKDKTTGKEYRIFVDAYTLDEVEDKPATEIEPGVWSMYDQLLMNGKDNNLKEWKKSDQLTNSIEQAASNKKVNINVSVTEENMKKLSTDAATTLITGKNLSVPLYGQERNYYCGPASCQMIGKYICNIYRTQNYIYDFQGWHNHNDPDGGISDSDAEDYCGYSQQEGGLGQSGTQINTIMSFTTAKTEINNYRPFFTMIPGHFRVCYGYGDTGIGLYYIYINDPLPVGSGHQTVEVNGAQERKRIYVRP